MWCFMKGADTRQQMFLSLSELGEGHEEFSPGFDIQSKLE